MLSRMKRTFAAFLKQWHVDGHARPKINGPTSSSNARKIARRPPVCPAREPVYLPAAAYPRSPILQDHRSRDGCRIDCGCTSHEIEVEHMRAGRELDLRLLEDGAEKINRRRRLRLGRRQHRLRLRRRRSLLHGHVDPPLPVVSYHEAVAGVFNRGMDLRRLVESRSFLGDPLIGNVDSREGVAIAAHRRVPQIGDDDVGVFIMLEKLGMDVAATRLNADVLLRAEQQHDRIAIAAAGVIEPQIGIRGQKLLGLFARDPQHHPQAVEFAGHPANGVLFRPIARRLAPRRRSQGAHKREQQRPGWPPACAV